MQLKALVPSVDSFQSSVTLTTEKSAVSEPKLATPTLTLSADVETHHILVTVNPPAEPHGGRRAPLDICCVIDVSGSMGAEASIPADPASNTPAEDTGLSVLDVVKHALRTIITTMQDDDRLALVAFSSTAKVVANLTRMTQDGQSQVLKTIDGLQPLNSTNLWDGLKVGMDLLKNRKDEAQKSGLFSLFKKDSGPSLARASTLFILTDGMPNVIPPRGHIAMLQGYLDDLDSSHTFNVNTFGFGYTLDSKLLLDIAKVGGGGYSFIPDSGIVGTVFVNAVSNAYATYAPRVRLDIEVPDDHKAEVLGGFPVIKTSWGFQIAAGDLQFGQTMDIVLGFGEVPKDITATLTYRPSTAGEDCRVSASLSSNHAAPQLVPIRYHVARLLFVELLWLISDDNPEGSVKSLQGLAETITLSPILANHPDALALEKDISVEGKLALEPANYKRWGRHYLPSLARSHQRQQCGNFKDPGLQVYGRDSRIFIEERNKLDAAFMALPPPKPSVRRFIQGGVAPRPLKSMSMFYSSSGPCFAGDCLVDLPGGRHMKVEDLKRGVEVQTLTGTNVVAAVVRTAIPSGETLLCRVGDLRVTPWHPILLPQQTDGENWVFPVDIASPILTPCDAVFSVLLLPVDDKTDDANANAHSVSIAGVWCVTLGHGLIETGSSDVRSHNFLGDYEGVLRALSHLKGFTEDGVVRCVGTRRNLSDGTICGFVGERETDDVDSHVAGAQRAL